MKRTLYLIIFLAAALLVTGCSGDKQSTAATTTKSSSQVSGAPVQEPGDEEFMVTALKSLTGLNITDAKIEKNTVTLTYEQITDDSQTVLVKRWLDLATVAMSFMEEPQTITIIPIAENTPVAKITVQAADVASFITGDLSIQEMLSLIQIEEPG